MTLLFDLACTQPNCSGKRHGGGKYGEIVFYRIVERSLPIVALYDSSRWFNPEIKAFIEKNGIELLDKQKEGSINNIVNKYGFNKVYSPIVSNEMFEINANIDLVGTIHGLRPLELSFDIFMLKYNCCSLREKCTYIIKKLWNNFGYKRARKFYKQAYSHENFRFAMVSYHGINALLAYMPQFKNKRIKVFYSPSTSKGAVSTTKYKDKYYLLVSANRWEKNCLRGIIAFDRLFSNNFLENTKVRITGIDSPSAFKYKLQNPEKFEFVGYVDDKELNQLYHDAYGFLYLSLNEGFGYPTLEAMHFGVPCITSPFTSIPEICQGAVIYANPYSIEEIMSRILLLENQEIHVKFSMLANNQENIIRQRQNEDLDKLIYFIYK